MGPGDMASGAQMGFNNMLSDMGSMIPSMAPPVQHPFIQARHGMYGHEFSMMGDLGALTGRNTPQGTTAHEFQTMAGRDFSDRVATGAVMGTMYTGSAAASWVGGSAAMSAGWKYGKAISEGSRVAASAMKVGATVGGRAGAGAALSAMGVAGGLMGAGIGMAVFAGAEATVGAIAENVQDRRDISNFLEASSFRYMQGQGDDIDSKMGSGFNRGARNKIASAIKNMDVNSSQLDMGDMKAILSGGTEMGMFSGTKDADEFAKKFKDLTETVKKVTTTLHQTVEEGMKTIKDLNQQGFRGSSAIGGAIVSADILGTASGKTAAEMLSVGRQGSEMVRGTGVAMASGSTMMQQNFAQISGMANAGTLDKEILAQLGGEGAAAQAITAQGLNFGRSNFGKGLTLAMQSSAGQFDAGRLNDLVTGKIGAEQAFDMASGNVQTSEDVIKTRINRSKVIRDMSKQFGGMGMQMQAMAGTIAQAQTIREFAPGLSSEEAYRAALDQQGVSPDQAEAQMAMFKDVQSGAFARRSEAGVDLAQEKAVGEMIRQRTNIGGRISAAWERNVTNPAGEGIDRAINNISDKVEGAYTATRNQIQKTLFGVERTELKGFSKAQLVEAISKGGQVSTDALSRDAKDAQKLVFTESESDAFGKSDAYSKMLAEHGDVANKVLSGEGMFEDVDDLSRKIFGGKQVSALSKDQNMFLSKMLRDSGSEESIKEFQEKQFDAKDKITKENHANLSLNNQKVDQAAEKLQKQRESFGGAGGFTMIAGIPVPFDSELTDAIQNLPKEGQEDFDKSILAQSEYKQALAKGVKGKELNDLRVKAQEAKSKAVSAISTQEDRETGMEFQSKLEKMDDGELKKYADSIGKSKEELTKATDSNVLMQASQQTAKTLDVFKNKVAKNANISTKKGFFGGSEAATLGANIDKLQAVMTGEGDELSDDELEELLAGSKKAGKTDASFGGITALASTLVSADQQDLIGKNVDPAKMEKFLQGAGLGLNEKQIQKVAAGLTKDGTVTQKEMVQTIGSFQIGGGRGRKGTAIAGAVGEGGAGQELMEAESKLLGDVVDAQAKMTTIINGLTHISDRVLTKAGK